MKAMRLMRSFAAALAFSGLTSVAALAEEGKKIDCADTDMQLKAQDFEFSCKDFSDPSAVSNAGKLGVELLEAISEKQEQYIAVWDTRAIGSIYLTRKGFEEDIRTYFSNEELAEWHAGGPVAGFEYAEYVNRRSGSSEEECIAFRRQMTRRNGGYDNAGFGRIVIGIGCTTRERAVLVESLKHLDAPGG
jgi:hypothetical protein